MTLEWNDYRNRGDLIEYLRTNPDPNQSYASKHDYLYDIEFEFDMPHYGLNFPFKWNQLYDRAFRKHLYSWARNFLPWPIKAPIESIMVCGHWIAFGYPHLKDPHMFYLVCRISFLTTFWDDTNENFDSLVDRNIDKSREFSRTIWNVMCHHDEVTAREMLDWKPHTFALWSTVAESAKVMPPRVFKHLQIYMTDYSNSFAEECSIAEGIAFFPQTEMGVINFRLANACATPFLQLVQLGVGSDIKQEERDETFDRLMEVGCSILIEVNDFYSLRKEVKECEGDLENCKNLIAVLAVKQKMGWQRAVNRLRDLLLELEAEWYALKKKIYDNNPSVDMVKFVDGMEYLLGGNLICHSGAKRYHGMSHKGSIASAGRWIYNPDYTQIIPKDEASANEFRKYDKFMDFGDEF